MILQRLYEGDVSGEARDKDGKWTGGVKPNAQKKWSPAAEKHIDDLHNEKISGHHAEEIGLALTDQTHHLATHEENGKLHGAIAYNEHPNHYEIKHFGSMQKGTGRKLLQPLIDKARKEGKQIHGTSTKSAEGFYKKMGFHVRDDGHIHLKESLEEYITGSDESGYTVHSHTGKRLGKYRSRKAAVKRLQQIEYFKSHPQESLPTDLAVIYEADSFANLYNRAGSKIRKHLGGVVAKAEGEATPKDLGGVKKHASGVTSYGGEREGFLSKLKSHFQSAVKTHRASRGIAADAAKAEAGATDNRPKIGGNPAGSKTHSSFAHEQSKKALQASKTAFLVHKSGTQNPTQLAKVHRSAMALHRTAKAEMENIGEKDMAAHHARLFKTHQKALHQTRSAQESVEEGAEDHTPAQRKLSARADHTTRIARYYSGGQDHEKAARAHNLAWKAHSRAAKAYKESGNELMHNYHKHFADKHEAIGLQHVNRKFGEAQKLSVQIYEDLPETNAAIHHSSLAHDASARANKSGSASDHKTAVRLHYRAAETHNAAAKASTPGTAAHAYHLDHAKVHTDAVASHRKALKGQFVMAGVDINARLYEGKTIEVFPEIKPVLKEENDSHEKDTGRFASKGKEDTEGRKYDSTIAARAIGGKHPTTLARIASYKAGEHKTKETHLSAEKAHHEAELFHRRAAMYSTGDESKAHHTEAAEFHKKRASFHSVSASELKESTADLLSRLYESDAEGTVDKKYPKNNDTSDNSDEYDDDFDDEDWMLDDDENFTEEPESDETLGKPKQQSAGAEKSKETAEGVEENFEAHKEKAIKFGKQMQAAHAAGNLGHASHLWRQHRKYANAAGILGLAKPAGYISKNKKSKSFKTSYGQAGGGNRWLSSTFSPPPSPKTPGDA